MGRGETDYKEPKHNLAVSSLNAGPSSTLDFCAPQPPACPIDCVTAAAACAISLLLILRRLPLSERQARQLGREEEREGRDVWIVLLLNPLTAKKQQVFGY
jgi:hypothetical protein